MSPGFTGVTVGLMLTLIHLITIPVDNTSVNPARSLATAVFQGSWALRQLWLFIVFPIVGGLLGALLWRALVPAEDA
jgi:aquaporin Z